MPDARVIVVPDIHAGYRQSRITDLVRLLPNWISTDPLPRLIFIGDVLDLWRASPADALAAAQPLFAVLRDFMTKGGTVDYLLGNHDYHLLPDLRSAQAIISQLPGAIRFYHRYLTVQHAGKTILLTHGDDYDLLYIPIQLLPFSLTPDQIYGFYEDAYRLDKSEIAGWDKDQLRGFLMAWIKRNFEVSERRGCLAAPLDALSTLRHLFDHNKPFFTPGKSLSRRLASPQTSTSANVADFTLHDYLNAFKTVSDLGEVAQHTPITQGWSVVSYAPYSDVHPITDFRPYDHLIVGHFHDPRQAPGLSVTDCGSWVTDPHGKLVSGTYVEIAEAQVHLHFTDSTEVYTKAL